MVITLFVAFFQGLTSGFSANKTNKIVNNSNTYSSDETWQVFNSTESNFKVSFPKYPTISEKETIKTSDNLTYILIGYNSTDVNNDIYNIYYGYYPEILSKNYNIKNGLENSVEGIIISNQQNELISSSLINFDKYQGIDYVIYNKQDFYMKGRNIIVLENNNPVKIYMLGVLSNNKNPTVNFTKFINSFKIL